MISPRLNKVATTLATALFAGLTVMQLGIALGVVPVTIVWGGSQTELTLGSRLASCLASCVLVSFAYIVQCRSLNSSSPWSRYACWFVTAYMILNTIGNLLSSNLVERYIEGSTTAILAICCGIVSLSGDPDDSREDNTGGYTTIQ